MRRFTETAGLSSYSLETLNLPPFSQSHVLIRAKNRDCVGARSQFQSTFSSQIPPNIFEFKATKNITHRGCE